MLSFFNAFNIFLTFKFQFYRAFIFSSTSLISFSNFETKNGDINRRFQFLTSKCSNDMGNLVGFTFWSGFPSRNNMCKYLNSSKDPENS